MTDEETVVSRSLDYDESARRLVRDTLSPFLDRIDGKLWGPLMRAIADYGRKAHAAGLRESLDLEHQSIFRRANELDQGD